MQHPDEGMIHSWLDGALSAEEAARVETHVNDCVSCAAAVAEARGFIAASSRILTALDDVPRGVLPAAPAKTRDLRVLWRAAAAMLIVAGGSLVVMRESGQDAGIATRAVTSSAVDQAAAASTARAPATEKAEGIREARPLANAATTAAVPTAPGALRMQMNAAPDSDAASLRVVKVERTPDSRRTTYQVTASEMVTLTEPEADSTLAARIVLRGNAAAVAARSAAPISAEAAKVPPPPPPSAMMDSKAAARFTAATNTVTWTELRTGKTLTLSGNVSVERLQEIRKRIETERASSGGKLP